MTVGYKTEASWWVAGTFSVLSSLLTFYQIRQHVRYNPYKQLRKHIIRILLMVPIYALESWLSLRFTHLALYFDVLRECYEAFVIYSFFQLLMSYLGGEEKVIHILSHKDPMKHAIPCCCLKPWQMADEVSTFTHPSFVEGEEGHSSHRPSNSVGSSSSTHSLYSSFLIHTQMGTLQYCVLRPACAVLAFLFESTDVYGEGEMRLDVGYPYLALIINFSQIWAMYCLVLFYWTLKHELEGLRPVPKFLTVKAVVFFTFWQYCLLVLLGKAGIIHDTESYDQSRLIIALQDFIICLEMLAAAAAHHWAFGHAQFLDPKRPVIPVPQPAMNSFLEALNVTDVYVEDVKDIKNKVSRKIRVEEHMARNNPYDPRNNVSIVITRKESKTSVKEAGGGEGGGRNDLSERLITTTEEDYTYAARVAHPPIAEL